MPGGGEPGVGLHPALPDLPAVRSTWRSSKPLRLPKPVPASRQEASGYMHAQAPSGWHTLSPTRGGCHIKWDKRTESAPRSIPSSEFQKVALPTPRGAEYANAGYIRSARISDPQ